MTMRYRVHTLQGEYSTTDLTEARHLGFVCSMWGDMGSVWGIPVPSRGRQDWEWLLSSGNGGGKNGRFYGSDWKHPDLFTVAGMAPVKGWMELAVSLGLINPERLVISRQAEVRRVLRGLPLLDFTTELTCPACNSLRHYELNDCLWCSICREYTDARTDYPELTQ